jgi:hypothetical protein
MPSFELEMSNTKIYSKFNILFPVQNLHQERRPISLVDKLNERWRSLLPSKLRLVAARGRKHGQNSFGVFSNNPALWPVPGDFESSKMVQSWTVGLGY